MLTYWLSTLLELDSSRENRDSHWLWLEAATQFAKLLRVCVVSSMQTTQVYRNVAACYLFKAKNELLAEIINTDHIYLNLDIHSHLRKLISALAFLSESTNFPYSTSAEMICPRQPHLIFHINASFLTTIRWQAIVTIIYLYIHWVKL